ncbi:hypothetical protein SCAR479_06835 [Seiridium cardinale]|uniref:Uncharacterized protein n=1 Tax=Seiridium cardinale TaxID=138064 RepID=A0ABR2XS54_9PEZI
MQQSRQPQSSQDAAAFRSYDRATESTTPAPPNSPNLSADETSNSHNSDTADDMGQFNNKNGPRGPQSMRPDMSEVLSLDQYKQLAKLINSITDGMNKALKELWEDMGNSIGKAEPRITGPAQLQASFVSIPNPYSPKYAHLFGNKPIYPEGEGPQDSTAAEGDDKATTDKVTTKPKPKFGKPAAPTLPPGMTANDTKNINTGNKSKMSGPPPAPVFPPGITPDMLPLKMPKTFQEAIELFGTKTNKDIMRNQVTELKRDSLAHFGKFRANVSKRIDTIFIRNRGREGNVVEPVMPFVRPASGSIQNNAGGRQQQQSQPMRTVSTMQQSGSALVSKATSEFDNFSTKHFSHHKTTLSTLPKEKRACILHCMTLILLGLENYSSYSRVFLCHLAASLQVPLHVLANDEARISQALSKVVEFITPEELQARRLEEGKNRFRSRPSSKQQQQQSQDAASLTNFNSHRPPNGTTGESVGGLAAPLVAAGLSTVFGGLGVGPAAAASMLQGMAESTVVVGTLFGLYGARATTKITEAYVKDIQDFGLLPVNGPRDRSPMVDPFDVPPGDRRLRLTICVAGFFDPNAPEGDNCKAPWKVLGEATEVYAVQWETEVLGKTGAAFDKLLKAPGWTEAKQDKTRSIKECINTSTWPAALIRNSKIIDNPWAVSLAKAEKCGQTVADAVLNKIGGERPVTLVGFGAGARAIWVALMALSEKRCFGFVENAVLIGSPSPSNTQSWAAARSVVSGRLVNVFSKNDIIMGFGMRLCNHSEGIAGLEEIVGVPGVHNYDVSTILTAHGRYRYLVGPILQRIAWEDVLVQECDNQTKELDKMIEDEKARDELRARITRNVAAVRAAQKQCTTAGDKKGKIAAAPATGGSKVGTGVMKSAKVTANGRQQNGGQQARGKENVRFAGSQAGPTSDAKDEEKDNSNANGSANGETPSTPGGKKRSKKSRSGKGRKRG